MFTNTLGNYKNSCTQRSTNPNPNPKPENKTLEISLKAFNERLNHLEKKLSSLEVPDVHKRAIESVEKIAKPIGTNGGLSKAVDSTGSREFSKRDSDNNCTTPTLKITNLHLNTDSPKNKKFADNFGEKKTDIGGLFDNFNKIKFDGLGALGKMKPNDDSLRSSPFNAGVKLSDKKFKTRHASRSMKEFQLKNIVNSNETNKESDCSLIQEKTNDMIKSFNYSNGVDLAHLESHTTKTLPISYNESIGHNKSNTQENDKSNLSKGRQRYIEQYHILKDTVGGDKLVNLKTKMNQYFHNNQQDCDNGGSREFEKNNEFAYVPFKKNDERSNIDENLMKYNQKYNRNNDHVNNEQNEHNKDWKIVGDDIASPGPTYYDTIFDQHYKKTPNAQISFLKNVLADNQDTAGNNNESCNESSKDQSSLNFQDKLQKETLLNTKNQTISGHLDFEDKKNTQASQQYLENSTNNTNHRQLDNFTRKDSRENIFQKRKRSQDVYSTCKPHNNNNSNQANINTNNAIDNKIRNQYNLCSSQDSGSKNKPKDEIKSRAKNYYSHYVNNYTKALKIDTKLDYKEKSEKVSEVRTSKNKSTTNNDNTGDNFNVVEIEKEKEKAIFLKFEEQLTVPSHKTIGGNYKYGDYNKKNLVNSVESEPSYQNCVEICSGGDNHNIVKIQAASGENKQNSDKLLINTPLKSKDSERIDHMKPFFITKKVKDATNNAINITPNNVNSPSKCSKMAVSPGQNLNTKSPISDDIIHTNISRIENILLQPQKSYSIQQKNQQQQQQDKSKCNGQTGNFDETKSPSLTNLSNHHKEKTIESKSNHTTKPSSTKEYLLSENLDPIAKTNTTPKSSSVVHKSQDYEKKLQNEGSSQSNHEDINVLEKTTPSSRICANQANKSNVHNIFDKTKNNLGLVKYKNDTITGYNNNFSGRNRSDSVDINKEQMEDKSVKKSPPQSGGENTILEAIKQFKYQDSSNDLILSNFISLSIGQYQIAKKIKSLVKTLPQKSLINSVTIPVNLNPNLSKTLIQDLDETLIRSEEAHAGKQYDKIIEVQIHNNLQKIGIRLRPFCIEFLRSLSKKFEIIIFTASVEEYANKVVDHLEEKLDLPEKVLTKRLCRQHCRYNERYYLKDLRIQNRKIEDMIIVDNLVYSFAFQVDNGIPILSFIDDKNDKELVRLEQILDTIRPFQDVRDFIRLNLRLNCFYNYLNRAHKGIKHGSMYS